MSKPPRSLLDRTFRYVPARLTDVRKTWARVRKEQEVAKQQTSKVVRPLRTERK